MFESPVEKALNVMANLAMGMPPENLTDQELQSLETLVKMGEKAKSVLIEREMEAMFPNKKED